MNTAKLAIKRPIFISSIIIIILVLGLISYKNIGLELQPDTSFPAIAVVTQYTGASPEEMDQLVSKPLEDEFGALSGLKHLTTANTEGLSTITLEFSMDTDIDEEANDVRDKINQAMDSLPDDIDDDPVVEKFDPNATAVVKVALESDLKPGRLYDIADEIVKPKFDRIDGVGTVNILGGSEREIQVEFDQNKLNEYKISMTTLVSQLQKSGTNVPGGSNNFGKNKGSQVLFRSMGQFTSLKQIEDSLVSFSGNVDNNSVTVKDLGRVVDGTKDVSSIGYVYRSEEKKQSPCLFLNIVKQSGSNTVDVANSVKAQIPVINKSLKQYGGNTHLSLVKDESHWILVNIHETVESIILGIILAIVIVYLFLGSMRSTLITAVAIPNSLLGAIIVMKLMGYTFNMITLMGMSLVVGLLVDDAIVVRENIFRKLEDGVDKFKAAEIGTTEVMLAVIATTAAIISVFFPVGMIKGMIGNIFKEFCFTIVFAMLVSLFDALTVAPFLSAYFAGDGTKADNAVIRLFEKMQTGAEHLYEKIMKRCLKHPAFVILATIVIFIGSVQLLKLVKITFMPTGDTGSYSVTIKTTSETSVYGTLAVMKKIGADLEKIPDIDYYAATAGTSDSEATEGTFDITLKSDRKLKTNTIREQTRDILKKYASSLRYFSVSDHSGGGDHSPFQLVVEGNKIKDVANYAEQIEKLIKTIPDLTDVKTTSEKGTPEFRIMYDLNKMKRLGVSATTAGTEIKYDIKGALVGTLRQDEIDYDVRARLKPEQRDLRKTFSKTRVPNSNSDTVPLSMISKPVEARGYAEIDRLDKMYTVTVSANMAQNGAVGDAITQANALIKKNIKFKDGVTYTYSGSSSNFNDSVSSMLFAMSLGLLFIYLVLSSLYESFVTPITILLAIPPAFTGAFIALAVTGEMMNIYSMIGMIMLMGLVTKNSILLVDNAVHGVRSGVDRRQAILNAGIRRLRPILMTTFAMLAGTLPLALGIGEAAKMRQSMGIAIIGGLIFSTLVTLIVTPAFFIVIDKIKDATESKIIVRPKDFWKEKN